MRRGKPNSGRSEKQVGQGVENNAKSLIATRKNEESTAVENGKEFGSPMAGGAFLTKLTYRVRIGVGFTKTVLYLTLCLVETRAGQPLFDGDHLEL